MGVRRTCQAVHPVRRSRKIRVVSTTDKATAIAEASLVVTILQCL